MAKTYKYRRTYTVGHTPEGKPVHRVVRSNDRLEFKAKCQQVENLLALEHPSAAAKITVEQYAYLWLQRYKQAAVGVSQYKNYEILIRRHICPVIGRMAVSAVKPIHAQEVLARTPCRSTSHLRRLKSTMHQIFNRAEADGLLERNPARFLELPISTTHQRRRLTEQEQAQLLEVAHKHRAGLWVRLMLQCGLRKGEATALRWEDVDTEHKLLHIERSVEFASGNKGTIKSTKTAAGVRVVPLPNDLFDDLMAYRHGATGFIFRNESGDGKHHMSQVKVRRMWSSFMRAWDIAAGAKLYRNKIIEHAVDQSITPHYLRHTYASNLYTMGVDLKSAQYLLGHSDIKTTANIYSHVSDSDILQLRRQFFSDDSSDDFAVRSASN